MLTNYQTQVQRLLQNPAAPTTLYTTADITSYINTARGQLAGEAECVRYLATINTVVGQTAYNFSDIGTGVSATNGIQGIINIRQMLYGLGTGMKWVPSRAWEWFLQYHLNNPVPQQGAPAAWSQFGQGAAPGSTGSVSGGTFYIDPAPDAVYTLYLDCVCYPIALADDTTKEAIPYLWIDAVPFFAAYYALLSSQTDARMADAERMMNHYTKFVERARQASNADVLRHQYSQAGDPVQANKLQIRGGTPGAG
ncbi:MAG TPA: hypothetical protein VIV09_02995 [Pseudolabrys sp.]